MNLIHTHIISGHNIELVMLCPGVDVKVNKSTMIFYNSVFDSVFITEAKNAEKARLFLSGLEMGVADIDGLVADCFNMDSRQLIAALYQKRIIE